MWRAPTSRCFATLKQYSLQGQSTGRAGCTVQTDTGHTVSTDVPRFMGGADLAPQPVELLLTALLGCKTATAHYVARHLWSKPHNRIEKIEWQSVVAERDNTGAVQLPITDTPATSAGLTRVRGVAVVTAHEGVDVRKLGEIVEERCPVAAVLSAAGCELEFEWRLAAPLAADSSQQK